MKETKNKKWIFFALGMLVAVSLIFIFAGVKKENVNSKNKNAQDNQTVSKTQLTDEKINAMMMLIEFENIAGVLNWEKELDNINITALVKVQDNILKEYPNVFKRLANKGYEIAGGYDTEAFWDMPYNEQYKHLKEAKDLVESVTGKTMRVFGSRYFAYDENTLKAADALGIEYILARGTQDVNAVIYQPEEYNAKIISVSNVDFGDMGRGSLCDYSLWARGSSPDEFGAMVEESIAKKPQNMILVSHSYLGGTRLAWWQEYEKALSYENLDWRGFDDWVAAQDAIAFPNAKIPVNREVKYVAPNPEKEIEEYEAVPGLDELEKNGITSTADDGKMICQ